MSKLLVISPLAVTTQTCNTSNTTVFLIIRYDVFVDHNITSGFKHKVFQTYNQPIPNLEKSLSAL